MTSFLELGVPSSLADVLARTGKTEAFPIQRATLPDSLAGRDVLGRGRTGSGKTIAFALPLVARLAATSTNRRASGPRGLILAPTRELATQIAATVEPLAAAVGLRVTTIFGGVSQKPQEQALRAGVEIVVACPGRLDDLMKQKIADLRGVEITVLDEADHMADLGFLPVVTRIMAATPADGQRLLFSATLDRGVDVLARRFLHDAVQHETETVAVPQGAMIHRVLLIDDADRKTGIVRALASGLGRRILFTRTKHQAKKLAKQLTAAGVPAVDLHGNLSQNARDRNLAAFSAGPDAGGVRVLVATDVAARGVHVDDVELVIHVDPPAEHKAYLHRSGRTARAGAEGTVVTVALAAQKRDVADLLRKASITAPFEAVTDALVDELVGERAPHIAPAPAAAQPQQQRSSGGRASGGRGSGRRGGASRAGEQTSGATREGRADAPRSGEPVRPTRSSSGRSGSRRASHSGQASTGGRSSGLRVGDRVSGSGGNARRRGSH